MKKNDLKKSMIAGLTAGVVLASGSADAALTADEINSSLAGLGNRSSYSSCGGSDSYGGSYSSCGGGSSYGGGSYSSCGGASYGGGSYGGGSYSSCGGASATYYQPSSSGYQAPGQVYQPRAGAAIQAGPQGQRFQQGQTYYQPGYSTSSQQMQGPQQGQWQDATRQDNRANQGWTSTSNLNQQQPSNLNQPSNIPQPSSSQMQSGSSSFQPGSSSSSSSYQPGSSSSSSSFDQSNPSNTMQSTSPSTRR